MFRSLATVVAIILSGGAGTSQETTVVGRIIGSEQGEPLMVPVLLTDSSGDTLSISASDQWGWFTIQTEADFQDGQIVAGEAGCHESATLIRGPLESGFRSIGSTFVLSAVGLGYCEPTRAEEAEATHQLALAFGLSEVVAFVDSVADLTDAEVTSTRRMRLGSRVHIGSNLVPTTYERGTVVHGCASTALECTIPRQPQWRISVSFRDSDTDECARLRVSVSDRGVGLPRSRVFWLAKDGSNYRLEHVTAASEVYRCGGRP